MSFRFNEQTCEPLERRVLLSAGDLDLSFGGGDGKALYFFDAPPGAPTDAGPAIVDSDVQPDGKAILFGGTDYYSKFYLERILPDGSRDPSFGDHGIVTAALPDELKGDIDPDTQLPRQISSVAKVQVLPNGKILALGAISTPDYGLSGGPLVARFNANGTIDQTFGIKGFAAMPLEQDDSGPLVMKVAPDGKIVVAGVYDETFLLVARFTASGAVDTSFSGDGWYSTFDLSAASAFDVMPDGRVVIGVRDYYDDGKYTIARFTNSGELDTTFDGDGLLVSEGAYDPQTGNYTPPISLIDLAVQPDGKIVGLRHSGYIPHQIGLVRYLPNGALDTTFDYDGVASLAMDQFPHVTHIALQADGRIIVGGAIGPSQVDWTDFRPIIARFTTSGAIDSTFGGGDGIVRAELMGKHEVLQKLKLSPDGTRLRAVSRADAPRGRDDASSNVDATWGAVRLKLDPPGGTASVTPDRTLVIEGTNRNDNLTLEGPFGGIVIAKWNNETIGTFETTSFDKVIIRGLGGNDRITGSNLSERIEGGSGHDSVSAGGGDDTIDGGGGADLIKGGSGRDTADYSSRSKNLVIGIGTKADDGEAGEKDNVYLDIEKVRGGSGNDRLNGSSGNNVFYGGKGNDTLLGNGGSDALFGEDGNDSLDGGASNDYLDGGRGNDLLIGGGGVDTMFGWDGNDTIFSRDGKRETLDGGLGLDKAQRDGFDVIKSVEGTIA